MAQVLTFPHGHRSGDDDATPMRRQCLAALRMLFEDMRAGRVDPYQMFIVYGDRRTSAWSYLNLEFDPAQLVRAVDLVIEDQSDTPG